MTDDFLKFSPYIVLNIIENTVYNMYRYNIHIKTHQLMFGENFSKMWSKWLQDSAIIQKIIPLYVHREFQESAQSLLAQALKICIALNV